MPITPRDEHPRDEHPRDEHPPAAQEPLDPALLDLRERVASGLARPRDVFATSGWVQVDTKFGGVITIEPEPAGFLVTCSADAFIDAADDAPRDDRRTLSALAGDALRSEVTRHLEALGLSRSPAPVWSTEDDDHGGSAHENWARSLPDVDAVIALVRALDGLTLRYDGTDE